MMIRVVLSLIGFFLFSVGFSQTGPGGVGDASNNAVWIDANRVLLTNGLSVSLLPDYSGNGNNFTQSTSTYHPTFTTSAINGLPAVDFDGIDDRLDASSISSIESAGLTYSIVYQKANLKDQGLLSASYAGSNRKWSTYSNSSNNKLITAHYSPSIFHENYIDNGNFNFVTIRIFPTYFEIFQNGELKATKNSNYSQPTGHNLLRLGGQTYTALTYFLDGFIAEAFIYSESLNDLELDILHNYLGAKYDITPFTDRYAYQATHNLEVIGLGNDGVNIHNDSKGAGVLRVSSPASLGVGDYLHVGHSGDIITILSSNVPASIPTHSRWQRVWRIDETGDLGALSIEFDLSQSNDFGSSSSYRLLQDTDGDFSNATVITGTYSSIDNTVTFSLDPNDGDYITLAGVAQVLTINSIASGNWSSTSTWDCNCVPGIADSVRIKGTHVVTLDINANIYNISLEASSEFKVTTGKNINIHGDFNIEGDLTVSDGSFSFVGNIDQEVNANTDTVSFLDMTILTYDTGDVKFTNGVFLLEGTLSPTFGTMIVDSVVTTKFIVNSTSTSTTGRIGEVFAGFDLKGDITVRRYIPSGNAGNRNIASPVIDADLSAWDDSLLISGKGFPDGCAYGDTTASGCYFSVKEYYDDHYIDITNSAHDLVNGFGYEVFMGDDLTSFSGTTLEVSGGINLSDVTTVTTSGWKIVGNPYASPVLFSSASTTNSLQDYFYVWDAASGGWQWYDGNAGTSSIPQLANGLIASGQAIWVNGFGFLTFPQSAKSSSSATFIRDNKIADEINIVLKQHNSTFYSKMAIAFSHEAEDDIDLLDVRTLTTGIEKASRLMMTYDGEKLTKNYLPKSNENRAIKISLSSLSESYYSINLEDLTMFGSYKNVFLIDHNTDEKHNLIEGDYTFHSEKGEFDRFTLILSNNSELLANEELIINANGSVGEGVKILNRGRLIELSNSSIINQPISFTIYNSIGQKVLEHSSLILDAGNSKVISLSNDLTGVYVAVVKSEFGTVSRKIIL